MGSVGHEKGKSSADLCLTELDRRSYFFARGTALNVWKHQRERLAGNVSNSNTAARYSCDKSQTAVILVVQRSIVTATRCNNRGPPAYYNTTITNGVFRSSARLFPTIQGGIPLQKKNYCDDNYCDPTQLDKDPLTAPLSRSLKNPSR